MNNKPNKIVDEKEELAIEKMGLEKDVMTIKDQLDTAEARATRDPKYASEAWRIRARDCMTYKKRRITDINMRLAEIKIVLRQLNPDSEPADNIALSMLKRLAIKTQELLEVDDRLVEDTSDERMHDRFDIKLEELRDAFNKVKDLGDGILI